MNWVHQRFVSMVQVLFSSLVTISNHMAWRLHPPFTWLVGTNQSHALILTWISYLQPYIEISVRMISWFQALLLYLYCLLYNCVLMEVWRFWCFLSSAQNNYMMTGKWNELRTAQWEIWIYIVHEMYFKIVSG